MIEGDEVTLAWYQAAVRDLIAKLRFEFYDGKPSRDGSGKPSIDANKIGVGGEMAVAAWRNVNWDCSVNTFKSRPDVGDYEVRTRTLEQRPTPDMMIRESDHDDSKFVLVIQLSDLRYRIVGAIRASEAKRHDEWKVKFEKFNGWFVPQSALHPLPRKTNA